MTPRWRLRTLGGLSLLRDGVAVNGVQAQRRRLALLAILAHAGESGVSRDKLLAMLWPESSTDSARHGLSQLLFLVRRDFESTNALAGASDLRLNPDEISSDVAELDRALANGDDATVVALYTGPFLDGFHLRSAPEFERWQDEQRTRLATAYMQSLGRLARAADERGDLHAAIDYRQRLATADPLDSRVALALMRSLAAAGDVTAALQHARLHETLLGEEIGVAPDPAITALATELRKRSSDPARSLRTEPIKQPPTSSAAELTAPEESAPVAVGRQSRRGLLVTMATLILLIAGVAVVMSSRSPDQLNESLVAVAPFEVLDPQLALWREGMLDVLARALDGAGPIRSVPPTAILRAWSGRGDVVSAAALGRATGAGFVVLGNLLRSGRDSVRGTTMLVSAKTKEIVTEREVRDAIEHIDRVADSLAIGVLEDIGIRQPVGAVRGATLGAASLPALKAFLRGEQLYRRGDMDSAYMFHARAVALDSNFALALHQLSAIGWLGIPSPIDSAYRTYAMRAQALNHRLPRRDSLLILLDSLHVVEEDNPFFGQPNIPVRNVRRMVAVARQAATEYPADPEALYQLGDVLHHFAAALGTSARDIRDVFDRAIASDSDFAPAYDHVVGLSLAEQDTGAARRYLRAMTAHMHSTPRVRAVWVLQLALSGALTRDSRSLTSLDSVRLEPIMTTTSAMMFWMDSAETARHLLEYLIARVAHSPDLLAAEKLVLALTLAERGHLRDAYVAYMVAGLEHARLFTELAILGAVPSLEATRTFDRWASDGDLLRSSRAAPWWAQQRDTQSLKQLSLRAKQFDRGADSIGIGTYVQWSSTLYLALARADTSGALVQCAATVDETFPLRFLEDVDCGRLLLARRRYREAERRLTPTFLTVGPIQSVDRMLEWARAAERAGDRVAAERGYAFVRAAWRSPDRPLASLR
jgi:serine/threonine-protein kinase